jgi:uncharacterized caspase-like protein
MERAAMSELLTFAGRAATIAAAAMLTACGSDAGEEPALNTFETETTLDEPANDASALESAVIDPSPAPVTNAGGTAESESEVVGETSGGDTGGNSVDGNVEGM